MRKKYMLIIVVFITLMLIILVTWKCNIKDHDTPHIKWSVCSFYEDEFSEEWQKGFNELLAEKGLDVEVVFEVQSLDRRSAGWKVGNYQAYGEEFAELMKDSDIITDCGQLGFYNSYSNYVRLGLYADITEYFQTKMGKQLWDSYPSAFWDSVRYEDQIYGVPSQENLSFTDYYVIPEEIVNEYDFNKTQMMEKELLELAAQISDENEGVLYKIPYRDFYCPEGYEEIPGNMPFIVHEEEDRLIVEYKLENLEYMDLLDCYNVYYQKGIWAAGVDLYKEDFLGVYVSSYSEDAAVQLLCNEYGWNPADYIAVKIGERPFRLIGNTTGINAASEEKNIAFEVLALAFSDEEIVNYIAYGCEGKDYELADGRVNRKNPVTESGAVETIYMTNHILTYPSMKDDIDKKEIFKTYYEELPRSILLNKWLDYTEFSEAVNTISGIYQEEYHMFCGMSENIDDDIYRVKERFSEYDIEKLQMEIQRQLNED